MKSKLLIPNKYKPLGWLLFSIGFILGIVILATDPDYLKWDFYVFPLISGEMFLQKLQWSKDNVSDEITTILLIIGGIIVAFSKTKEEDEYISKLRMDSLIWAVYVSYFILFLATLFVFEFAFFNVMMINMFTILIFFIVRFHFLLYRSKRLISYEE